MESGELTERIAARVKEKLEQMGITVSDGETRACMNGSSDTARCASCCRNGEGDLSGNADRSRRTLLLLTEDHGTDCHAVLENSELAGAYDVECALLSDYKINMEQVDSVILFNLTCANLSKLCSGMADTPYLKTALRAVMSGKRLFVSSEEIEYLRYEKTMPAPMWKKLSGELDFLKSCGLCIVPKDKLVCAVMDRTADKVGGTALNQPEENAWSAESSSRADRCEEKEREISIDRKVVTERDVIEAGRVGAVCIRTKKGCIITDLAGEAAMRRGIRFCSD